MSNVLNTYTINGISYQTIVPGTPFLDKDEFLSPSGEWAPLPPKWIGRPYLNGIFSAVRRPVLEGK